MSSHYLHAVADSGNLLRLRELLDAGANINLKLTYHTNFAKQNYSPELLKLVEAEPEPVTTLTVAAESGKIDCLRELLERGANDLVDGSCCAWPR